MATTTPPGTPVPTLGDPPNVPADMLKLATWLDAVSMPVFADASAANTGLPSKTAGQLARINSVPSYWNGTTWVSIAPPSVQSYTPDWVSIGDVQPAIGSGGHLVGRYQVVDKVCHVWISIFFGTGPQGGRGELKVGIPFPANGVVANFEQSIPCKLWNAGNGATVIGAGYLSGSYIVPYLPLSASQSNMGQWRQNSTGVTDHAGVPLYWPGQDTIVSNGRFTASGSYYIA